MAENKTPAAPLEEEEYQPELITLEDEEGKEHVFEVLDETDHKDVHYMALVPYITDEKELLEEDLSLLLMRVDEDEEGQFLDVVDDDSELHEVGKIFQERLSEIFNIEA